MKSGTPQSNIVIAGAGGIGQAVALILAEYSETPIRLFIGNRSVEKAKRVVQWLKDGATRAVEAFPFPLQTESVNPEMKKAFGQGDVLLDCLPGSFAPQMAGFARQFSMGYANLTEYVEETDQISALARDADRGFVLQTGLAPGFINVLGHALFHKFCRLHQVDRADYLAMKVGALTRHATAPHFYGFTWSPVGVATEYVKEATCIRDHRRTVLPSLSERETIIIDGRTYEADLTSGGAADLPEALAGRVERLDYKTLRYPGHYAWVEEQLNIIAGSEDKIELLQSEMEACIPHLEDDMVIIYAYVEGRDGLGELQKTERAYRIFPQVIGKHQLRAIQTTTAAPLAQAAGMLLSGNYRGPVFQSEIDPGAFLNGRFVTPVYGEWEG